MYSKTISIFIVMLSITSMIAPFNRSLAGNVVSPEQPAAMSLDPTKDKDTLRKTDMLQITDAWARKSMSPNNNSAAYMKVTNTTNEQITIIGASSSMVANNVELHKSFVDEKGVSRMTAIDKIVVPAQSSIELSPGGIHIMLLDLKRGLATGDKFDVTIKIEGKEPMTVSAIVK